MVEAFFGFKKTPFGDSPDAKQLFASQSWNQARSRLQFLADHHGAGLITGEVGSGKSTAARSFTTQLNPSLFKVIYLHWTPGSTLDLLRQLPGVLHVEVAVRANQPTHRIIHLLDRHHVPKDLLCGQPHNRSFGTKCQSRRWTMRWVG